MNINQAKQIPLEFVLTHWGHQPVRQKGTEIWYLSPLRAENTPSFHIDTSKQIWFDFGEGKGGTIIDLVQAWLNLQAVPSTIPDVLKWCERFDPGSQPKVRPKSTSKPAPKIYRFLEDKPLTHPKLFEYLNTRAIDCEIAGQFVREASLWHREKQREYYGLSFANDNGGIEFRNPYMKASFGRKAITTLKGVNSDVLQVFEGFMDFLSLLTVYETHKHHSTVIVLNSLALQARVLQDLENFQGTIYSWYDNDQAGRSATKNLLHWAKDRDNVQVRPMNDTYDGYKDVNEWVCGYAGLKKN